MVISYNFIAQCPVQILTSQTPQNTKTSREKKNFIYCNEAIKAVKSYDQTAAAEGQEDLHHLHWTGTLLTDPSGP